MVTFLALVWLAFASGAAAQVTTSREGNASSVRVHAIGRPGWIAHYRYQRQTAIPGSVVTEFSLALGPIEEKKAGEYQWICLSATKANGGQFRVWLLTAGYPPLTLQAARTTTTRYILQEGSSPPREYRNSLTGEAVLPAQGGWEYLIPRPAVASANPEGKEVFPKQVRYLGHPYAREALTEGEPVAPPPDAKVIELRPDVLVGPANNTRQKDETRRYDDSDYELVRLTRDDYRQMAEAGINCVAVDAEQAHWADELNLYYWGAGGRLPFPESLYRSQYLGPALFLDEPAVGTRDYVIRPKLAKDEAFRKALTPQVVFDAFREHFQQALRQGPPMQLMRGLAARPDVDLGNMNFPQENIYSWDTMVSTAAYQLSQDPRIPDALVFEPPGRIGTLRTLPEIDMTYGTQLPVDDPKYLADIIFGFLRGAARLTGKSWGVSIYGGVQRADTFWWLTHAYDLGATRFFFWDTSRLACVPYGEYLALSRNLHTHADSHPHRDLARLRRAAEVAILLPPGYNLGHVQLGKGSLWGIGELNLERVNRKGVKYRVVMSNFFREIERCLRLGIAFDLLWDLPNLTPTGYREVVRIREDGKVDIWEGGKRTVLAQGRLAPRAPGLPPHLAVTLAAHSSPEGLEIAARARIVEKSAPVYYTLGADPKGVYHNAMVAWELYGPGEEDYRYLVPEGLRPQVRRNGSGGDVDISFQLNRPGRYRLRTATVDMAGRTSVIWKRLVIFRDAATGRLTLR